MEVESSCERGELAYVRSESNSSWGVEPRSNSVSGRKVCVDGR